LAAKFSKERLGLFVGAVQMFLNIVIQGINDTLLLTFPVLLMPRVPSFLLEMAGK